MSIIEVKERIAEASPRFKDGITGVFYLVTIVTGGVVLFADGRMGLVFGFIASACFIAVAALFYELSR
jgi:hypothetical protein